MPAEVCVYFNLRTRLWSLCAVAGNDNRGAKIESVAAVTLRNARMVVKESGRQRIMRRREREVIAWIIGERVPDDAARGAESPITFCPYRGPDFTVRASGHAVRHADFVRFNADGRAVALGEIS